MKKLSRTKKKVLTTSHYIYDFDFFSSLLSIFFSISNVIFHQREQHQLLRKNGTFKKQATIFLHQSNPQECKKSSQAI